MQKTTYTDGFSSIPDSLDGADSRRHRREVRRKERLPIDLRCPACRDSIPLMSRRWVLKSGLCRDCHFAGKAREWVLGVETRYRVLDTGRSVSQEAFARILGVSRGFVARLETEDILVGADLAKKMVCEPVEKRYEIDGQALRNTRLSLGISKSEMARRCGWPMLKIIRIENSRKWITQKEFQILTSSMTDSVA